MVKNIGDLQKELGELEESIAAGEYRAVNPQGKPITPNQVRNDIRKYLQESGSTQSKFLSDIGVNSNSFGKFMNGSYKDSWAACQNGTYDAACAFFAKKRIQDKINEISNKLVEKVTGKRMFDDTLMFNDGPVAGGGRQFIKKSRNIIDAELQAILHVPVPDPCPVYANCDEVRELINDFVTNSGVTQSRWLKILDVASNSLSRFMKMSGKGVGAGNSVYYIAWKFFEQKRLLDGLPKSQRRLEQEERWGPAGFPLRHDDGNRYILGSSSEVDPRIYDIEWCQDNLNIRRALAGNSSSSSSNNNNSYSQSQSDVNNDNNNNNNTNNSSSSSDSSNGSGAAAAVVAQEEKVVEEAEEQREDVLISLSRELRAGDEETSDSETE